MHWSQGRREVRVFRTWPFLAAGAKPFHHPACSNAPSLCLSLSLSASYFSMRTRTEKEPMTHNGPCSPSFSFLFLFLSLHTPSFPCATLSQCSEIHTLFLVMAWPRHRGIRMAFRPRCPYLSSAGERGHFWMRVPHLVTPLSVCPSLSPQGEVRVDGLAPHRRRYESAIEDSSRLSIAESMWIQASTDALARCVLATGSNLTLC